MYTCLHAHCVQTMPYLSLVFTVLCWASNFIVAKGFSADLDPVVLSFLRWLCSTALIIPFCIKRLWQLRVLIKKHFLYLSGMGIISITMFTTALYLGLESSTVNNATIMQSTTPIVILLMGAYFFKEPVSGLQWFGVSVSFFGILVLVAKADLSTLIAFRLAEGDLYLFIAMILWALYSVLLRKLPKGIDNFSFFSITVVIGTVVLSPLALVNFADGGFPEIGKNTWAFIFYLAIFPSILAGLFWNYGVKKLGAATCGLFVHLVPIFGFALSSIFLGEKLMHHHIIGLVLVLIGVFVSLPNPLRAKLATSD